MNEDSQKKRVALVTGSTSGIGKAIAQRLAQDSFTLAFHSKSSIAAGKVIAKAHLSAFESQTSTLIHRVQQTIPEWPE